METLSSSDDSLPEQHEIPSNAPFASGMSHMLPSSFQDRRIKEWALNQERYLTVSSKPISISLMVFSPTSVDLGQLIEFAIS